MRVDYQTAKRAIIRALRKPKRYAELYGNVSDVVGSVATFYKVIGKLIDEGIVERDPAGRRYRLTEKGMIELCKEDAVEALERLFDRMDCLDLAIQVKKSVCDLASTFNRSIVEHLW